MHSTALRERPAASVLLFAARRQSTATELTATSCRLNAYRYIASSRPYVAVKVGLISAYFDVCLISNEAELCSAMRAVLAYCIDAELRPLLSTLESQEPSLPIKEGFALLSMNATSVLSQLASHTSPPALCSAVLALLHTAEVYGFSQYIIHTAICVLLT